MKRGAGGRRGSPAATWTRHARSPCSRTSAHARFERPRRPLPEPPHPPLDTACCLAYSKARRTASTSMPSTWRGRVGRRVDGAGGGRSGLRGAVGSTTREQLTWGYDNGSHSGSRMPDGEPAHPLATSHRRIAPSCPACSRRGCRRRRTWRRATRRCPCLRARGWEATCGWLCGGSSGRVQPMPACIRGSACRLLPQPRSAAPARTPGHPPARPPTVVVVLADEDAGQVPQARHVERLKHLALRAVKSARREGRQRSKGRAADIQACRSSAGSRGWCSGSQNGGGRHTAAGAAAAAAAAGASRSPAARGMHHHRAAEPPPHLVGRAVSVHGHRHAAVALVLVRQRQARAQRHLLVHGGGGGGRRARQVRRVRWADAGAVHAAPPPLEQRQQQRSSGSSSAAAAAAARQRQQQTRAGRRLGHAPARPRCPGRRRSWPRGGTCAWSRPCPWTRHSSCPSARQSPPAPAAGGEGVGVGEGVGEGGHSGGRGAD